MVKFCGVVRRLVWAMALGWFGYAVAVMQERLAIVEGAPQQAAIAALAAVDLILGYVVARALDVPIRMSLDAAMAKASLPPAEPQEGPV